MRVINDFTLLALILLKTKKYNIDVELEWKTSLNLNFINIHSFIHLFKMN